MPPAPLPANEVQRLKALHTYNILDSMPEAAFDDITNYAAEYFKVPIALISLVDLNRQWFKSCVGLPLNWTDRDESFCAHAILEGKPFIIPDTHLDTRFATNPLVIGEPFIRFYAGAQLITPQNYALGTLCLIDRQPRTLSAKEEQKLVDMASTVMTRINLRLTGLMLKNVTNELQP